MVKAALYIEGGGKGKRAGQIFRRGWSDFFRSAGLAGNLPSIVQGGSRNTTFARFTTALQNARADELPILLVDSEVPVDAGHSAWEHLRVKDGWQRPTAAADTPAFLMVQVMETWLLADRDALRKFFGQSFHENSLPAAQSNLESIPKANVLQSLEGATARCAKRYAKGTVSFEVLARINPDEVAARCPHAKAILDYLRRL